MQVKEQSTRRIVQYRTPMAAMGEHKKIYKIRTVLMGQKKPAILETTLMEPRTSNIIKYARAEMGLLKLLIAIITEKI